VTFDLRSTAIHSLHDAQLARIPVSAERDDMLHSHDDARSSIAMHNAMQKKHKNKTKITEQTCCIAMHEDSRETGTNVVR